MNSSNEWDNQYKNGLQMSIWPWSDLVSYVMRYARPKDEHFRVLELGCGAGANIPFFLNLNVKANYYAIEGSQCIVKILHEKYPFLKKNIIVADFTREIPVPGKFDLIIDRASVTHNSTKAIKSCLKLVKQKLKNNGRYIGIDWFSTKHSDFNLGQAKDDYTRINIGKGQFTGVGRVHFSDRRHLEELFSGFHIERMEHKIYQQVIPEDAHVLACWDFVVKKE